MGKITAVSYKERLRECLFSWDERREKWDRWGFFGTSELLSQAAPVEWHKRLPSIFMWHSPEMSLTLTGLCHYFKQYVVGKGFGMGIKWLRKKTNSSSLNCLKYQHYCHSCCRNHPSECSLEAVPCLEKREQLKYFPGRLNNICCSKDLICHVGLCNSTSLFDLYKNR